MTKIDKTFPGVRKAFFGLFESDEDDGVDDLRSRGEVWLERLENAFTLLAWPLAVPAGLTFGLWVSGYFSM